MTKLIIVTHGSLAAAFSDSCEMFFGDQAKELTTIGLFPSKSPEQLKEEIQQALTTARTDEFLIFVDILAGTPFNVVALLIDELKEKYQIECFAGVNMPLVMEALASKETMSAKELSEHIDEMAATTIVNLRKMLEI